MRKALMQDAGIHDAGIHDAGITYAGFSFNKLSTMRTQAKYWGFGVFWKKLGYSGWKLSPISLIKSRNSLYYKELLEAQ